MVLGMGVEIVYVGTCWWGFFEKEKFANFVGWWYFVIFGFLKLIIYKHLINGNCCLKFNQIAI